MPGEVNTRPHLRFPSPREEKANPYADGETESELVGLRNSL